MKKAILATADIARIIEAASSDPEHGIYYAFPFLVGTRPSEQLGLLWEDVDFDANVVRICRIQERDGSLTDMTKTEAGTRDNGQGVSLDNTQAAKWFRKAAEQGLAEAQSNLGFLYAVGQGVPQDFVLAHMWLNLAAAQGYAEAMSYRDEVVKLMAPDQLAEAQRLAREWKPTTP